ncbi:MAG: BMP family protein [Chloroflexi bacterium]|nr:BMP family protein [Chloroflexota bacterium]
MSKNVRKVIRVFCILLVIAMLAACAPAVAPSPTPVPKKSIKAVVLLEGPLADTGWNTSSWAALQELSKKYGWEVTYSDNTETSNMEDLMRSYASKNYDIVFGPGWLFGDPMLKVSPEFPNTKWVQLNENNKGGDNFSSNGWITGEMAYFMGKVAAKMSPTGKLAWIAGTESTIVSADKEIFEAAAKEVNPNVTVVISYVGSWQDPVKAKELAKANIEGGVDVILSIAGSGDFGVFEAIKEANQAGKKIKVEGWTGDICSYMPNDTLVSLVQLPGSLLKLAGEDFQAGKLKPGHSVYSVKDGAQNLAWCGTNTPSDYQKEIDQGVKDYINGKLQVPIRPDL